MAPLPPSPRLQGAAVVLRPWAPEDVDVVRAAAHDPRITEITSVPVDADTDAALAFVTRQHDRHRRGEGWPLAIVAADTGTAVGQIGAWPRSDDAGRMGIGYWLVPAHRGRGFATDAVRTLVAWALDLPGVHRLELFAEPENLASRRVAERAGFAFEGVLRSRITIAGVRRDVCSYALVAGSDAAGPEVAGSDVPGRDAAGSDGAAPTTAPEALAEGFGSLGLPLHAEGLTLRPWRADEADAAALVAIRHGDPEIVRWTPVKQPYLPEDALATLEKWRGRWADGTGAALAIVDEAEEVVGEINLIVRSRPNRAAEIAYSVAAQARRRRVAARALPVVRDVAFGLGLRRTVLRIEPGNVASWRLALGAGFRLEGIQRSAEIDRGRAVDLAIFAHVVEGD